MSYTKRHALSREAHDVYARAPLLEMILSLLEAHDDRFLELMQGEVLRVRARRRVPALEDLYSNRSVLYAGDLPL
jgi:hypothetical protein